MQTKVWCTLQFEGFHCWPGFSGFLGSMHRHMFHVRAEKIVTGLDREIEFIELKHQLSAAIQLMQDTDQGVETWSCEQWAKNLLEQMSLDACEVSEDGENGARLEK